MAETAEISSKILDLRPHQRFVVELALKQNTIACLPTGSGKTLIAVELTKCYLNEAIKKGQKIIFLTSTVPLAKQQAEYFRAHLSNTASGINAQHVDCLTGDRNVRYWQGEAGRQIWNQILSDFEVLVMTSQIFLDAINHTFIGFEKVMLLVMDECHHAIKDDAMNKIMERYMEYRERYLQDETCTRVGIQIPRILGLTASIINGKNKLGTVEMEVKAAEERLCSKAVTYHTYEEVLKYSTNAKMEYVTYTKNNFWDEEISQCLVELKDLISTTSESLKRFENRHADKIQHPSLQSDNQLYGHRFSELKALISLLDDVLGVFEDLGPYCARLAAIQKRAILKTILIANFENQSVQMLYYAVDPQLLVFISKIDRLMSDHDESNQIQVFITKKLKALLSSLSGYTKQLSYPAALIVTENVEGNVPSVNDNELCGIVFVKKRVTAQILNAYLQDVYRLGLISFVKPCCVVGTSSYDTIEAPISARIQASTLQSFRNKTHNLLVATNVVEEGLDVPACNLVVRFDKIESYPSYIQSMGRARSGNSKFYAILEKSEERKQIDEYEKFKEFNIELSGVLRRNAIHADEDVGEFGVDVDTEESLIPSFQPVRGGPRITPNDAISIVYRYCQTLPCDKLSVLTPISWWVKVGAGYQAFVQLPSNSVIRREIEGEVYGSKTLAKRSAFMNACKLLYEENVFDDNLYPIARKSTSVIDSFLEGLPAETDSQGRKVGSTKRTQRYKKKIPMNSEYGDIIPGLKCNAYELAIELMSAPSHNDEITTSLYQFDKRQFSYCLITTADLSIIPQFILNVGGTVGCLKVTLKQYDDGITLSAEGIGKLLQFERYLFGDILKLKNEILLQTKSTSFLFAPALKTNAISKATHLSVHWELVERLLGIPKDFFNPPSKEKRKNFVCNPQLYEGAVVIPWHREEEISFYTVMDVLEGTTPLSIFEDGKQGYKNYESYYLSKYPHINFISDPLQPLIKAKKISTNLNFFKRSAAFKRSLEERKDDSGTVVTLIPELTNIHPMPAALYIQSKFLPSILQRINRFLSARQIQQVVAAGTSWETQEDSMEVDVEEELINLFDDVEIFYEPPNKKQLLQAGCSTNTVTGTGTGDESAASSAYNKVSVKHPAQLLQLQVQLKSGQTTEIPDDVASLSSLANIHPNQIKSSHIRQVKNLDSLRRRQRKESKLISAGSRSHSRNNIDYLKWNYAKETLYCKELTEFSVIEELLETTKKFDNGNEDSSTQPSLYTIMQAITTEGSLDSVSLERLETMGDSFLKYCVCRHVFSHFPGFNEGDMTRYKSEFVSNAFLYGYGKKFQLGGYLGAGIFQPHSAWLPPSFTMPTLLAEVAADNDVNEDVFNGENISELIKLSRNDLDKIVRGKRDKVVGKMPVNVGYDYARVADKSIADSVEALIGAYFLAAGSVGALRFMEKLGLRGPCLKEVGSTEVTSEIFGNWPLPTTVYEPGQDCVENHLPFYKELEQLIGYKFNEPWILVEAFSHPSYVRNRVTGCYQRLEFLGDAVLDFLITTHIFKESDKMKPGQLTDLRSALVNNVTFGSLAVRYGLHLYLRHGSEKNLQERIDDFVQRQRDVGHNVEGHFKLLSDFDTPCVEDIEVPKVLGDLFESLAGAVFVDSGMSLDTVWKIFYRLMKNEIDEFSMKLPKSPVRELYERFPGRKIFKEWTGSEASSKPMPNRKPGFSYVTLTMPYFGLDAGIKPHVFIGMGKSKQSAKVGLAKYINYLETKKLKNRV